MNRAFEGNTIIVTGGGSGNGRAAAIACAAARARVVVADIGVAQGEDTVPANRQQDGEAIFVATDVADEAQVEALVAAAVDNFGRLDGAFNNAGLAQTNALLHDLTAAQWRRIQSVNYDSVFFFINTRYAQCCELAGAPSSTHRPLLACAVQRRRFPSGCKPHRQLVQPEATGAIVEVTKRSKPLVKRVTRHGDSSSGQAVTRMNAE
ncbi:SDR family NAD(P)-dependent oxidoreductase [Paraburkholderia aromaticivorans]|uniref:SDR family NAD(P)-dependent oxidoreductase n=1 Tax=Paraburkholderia aromaticivorans TaxID=2026199 RepID=UPI001F0D773F|nr:SDR family NAD(P)-dependent oxidoreductase [Paraburkholderia aromaticivorans]